MKHAAIVPLIGGLVIGQSKAFCTLPEYLLSYSDFEANDSHLIDYYKTIPYYQLDKTNPELPYVDVICSTCPCAGLSRLSKDAGSDNLTNDWLIKTTDYVLRTLKPKVLWGENAPALAGAVGKPIREKMQEIGKEFGYTMSVYRTKSELHGNPQIRERSFYFFWKGDKTPLLSYYNTEYTPIEKLIANITSNSMRKPINKNVPSRDDPYYRYILENIHEHISHREFSEMVQPRSARNSDALAYIEQHRNYLEVAEWMKENGYDEEVERCERRYEKLKAGKEITRRHTIVPKDKIGAFVGRYPYMLTHPTEDRYIDFREALTIMGMPDDFEMKKANTMTVNHICQNVPVQTAQDMASEVKKYLQNELVMVDTDFIMQYNGTRTAEYNERKNTLEEFFT